MAQLTWIITLLTLPALALGNKNESNKIHLQSVSQVITGIYRNLHSKFVILLHESTKNEGGKYRTDLSSLWLLFCMIRSCALSQNIQKVYSEFSQMGSWSWVLNVKVTIAMNFKVLCRPRQSKTRKISSVSGTFNLCFDEKIYLFITNHVKTCLNILAGYKFRPTFKPSLDQYIIQLTKKPYNTAYINLGTRSLHQVIICATVWFFRNL
jgi:hypothetical protein